MLGTLLICSRLTVRREKRLAAASEGVMSFLFYQNRRQSFAYAPCRTSPLRRSYELRLFQ